MGEDADQHRDRQGAGSEAAMPCEHSLDRFWQVGPEFDAVAISVEPPDAPLALLERLGPSPFERGGFPVIGFLATTYDKVSRYALSRHSAPRP
jgi:uncharacterized Zn finger protein